MSVMRILLEEVNRKLKRWMSVLALAISVASAAPAWANVEWSSTASGCVLQSGSADLASVSAVFGTVTFADGMSGHIKLTCPVQKPLSASANALFVTYYNDHSRDDGVDHCYVYADLLRTGLNSELGGDLGWVHTDGQFSFGRQMVFALLSEPLDFNNNYYWVDVDLYRDAGDAVCNPVAVGVILN